MNTYAILIICTLVVVYIMSLVAQVWLLYCLYQQSELVKLRTEVERLQQLVEKAASNLRSGNTERAYEILKQVTEEGKIS